MNKKTILNITILMLCAFVTNGAIASQWTPAIWQDFVANGSQSQLPDFSYAGYKYGEEVIPDVDVVMDVTNYGATPDDGIDDSAAIQTAINIVGTAGGGTLYFPAGEYTIDVSADPNFIRINQNGVVLRGAGEGEGGTVLNFKNMDYQSVPNVEGFICVGENLSPELWGSTEATVAADAMRGSDILQVADVNDLQAGELVHITMKNTNDLPNLTEYLISPLEIDPAWTNAYNSSVGYTYFRWLVEIDEIIDSTHIRLKQPLRENILTVFEPYVRRISTIREVGIEDMKIVSDLATDGGASDENYWPRAVVFKNSVNCWVRNVTVENFSVGVNMQFCKNVTARNITIDGVRGAFGVLLWGTDCMVDDITINSQRRKAITVHNYSQGNVIRNVLVNYAVSGTQYTQGLDYHGNYSLENLMENITNARSNSSGSVINYPNSSHRNTFWNIKTGDMAPSFDPGNENEFFANWWYSSDHTYARKDAHKSMPKSIVVGVYNDTVQLEIEGSTADRSDEWIYVEGLNQQQVYPSSLYQAQFDLRVSCVANPKGDLNDDCKVDIKDFSILASEWLSSLE